MDARLQTKKCEHNNDSALAGMTELLWLSFAKCFSSTRAVTLHFSCRVYRAKQQRRILQLRAE
jgi:hypothetical protein